MPGIDRLILAADRALRVLVGGSRSARPYPALDMPETRLPPASNARSIGLMRVNHAGEVCAQALYDGQSLLARNADTRRWLEHAATEEADHLAWTAARIRELGGSTSLLNPLWYGGALALGVSAALLGDRLSLGFLRETERQVVAHLDRHLAELPQEDMRSRAILVAMKADEAMHADSAQQRGGRDLPPPLPSLMKGASRVMTTVARYL